MEVFSSAKALKSFDSYKIIIHRVYCIPNTTINYMERSTITIISEVIWDSGIFLMLLKWKMFKY